MTNIPSLGGLMTNIPSLGGLITNTNGVLRLILVLD